MKIAITVSTKDAYSEAMVVFRGIEEHLRCIAELGYDGIELAVFDKSNFEAPRLKRLLSEYRLQVPVLSTGQIYTFQDLWFTHPRREIREKAVVAFKDMIEMAAEFGADVNTSRMRGRIPQTDSYEEGIARLTGCLEELCRHAERYGINLLIEQMNRYETNYLLSVSEVGEYIRNTGIPNLRLHPDTFHMNIEDVDFAGALREYRDILGYLHVADSNRLPPGKGHFDFPPLFESLKTVGYDGWIGVEVLPRPTPEEAARQSIAYLRKYVPKKGGVRKP